MAPTELVVHLLQSIRGRVIRLGQQIVEIGFAEGRPTERWLDSDKEPTRQTGMRYAALGAPRGACILHHSFSGGERMEIVERVWALGQPGGADASRITNSYRHGFAPLVPEDSSTSQCESKDLSSRQT